MRRADRLFQIIQFLRTRRVTTAQWLARRLEVSERTIYRDIQDYINPVTHQVVFSQAAPVHSKASARRL